MTKYVTIPVMQVIAREGKCKTTTFTCPVSLLSLTDEVVAKLEQGGHKVNRSRLLQALLEITLEVSDRLDPRMVINHDALCFALKKAIRAPRHKHY